jgi:prepilin-type N-terminal cleavage/methylation domain-containing protein
MSKGFTLIELMVSIAVMTVVSSVFLAGKYKEDEKMALRMSAFTFSQNLREYQEKALSGENIVCPNPAFQICGFGAHLKAGDDFFTPFVDCSNNCGTSNHTKTNGIDRVYPDVKFGPKVKICSMTNNDLDVIFTPPDPAVYLNSVKWLSGEKSINLCLKSDASQIKTVKLNYAGKIEIQ